MKVSFNGIKNVAYYKSTENLCEPLTSDHVINMELTDDSDGRHLTEYKNAIKNSFNPKFEYTNTVNPNFLNIEIFTTEDSDTEELAINGKPVEDVKMVLPLINFIRKVTKNIANTPEDNFIVNSRYLRSPEAYEGILLGGNLKSEHGKEAEKIMYSLHRPSAAKKGAENINRNVISIVENLFDRTA